MLLNTNWKGFFLFVFFNNKAIYVLQKIAVLDCTEGPLSRGVCVCACSFYFVSDWAVSVGLHPKLRVSIKAKNQKKNAVHLCNTSTVSHKDPINTNKKPVELPEMHSSPMSCCTKTTQDFCGLRGVSPAQIYFDKLL